MAAELSHVHNRYLALEHTIALVDNCNRYAQALNSAQFLRLNETAHSYNRKHREAQFKTMRGCLALLSGHALCHKAGRTGRTRSKAYNFLRWGKPMGGGGTDCHGRSILHS